MAAATKLDSLLTCVAREELPHQEPDTSSGAMALLNHLRFVAMSCRSKARTNLFEACALLHGSQSVSRDVHAEALMRCLGEALGKPARLFAPGTEEMTFDERWLLQLANAFARDDQASFRFLIGSRVAHENRRLIAFLMGRITEYFSLD